VSLARHRALPGDRFGSYRCLDTLALPITMTAGRAKKGQENEQGH